MNTRLLIAAFFLLAALVTLPSAFAAGAVDIQLVSQDPDPAGPGNLVDVTFHLQNTGNVEAKDLRLEVLDIFPFQVVGERSVMISRVPFLSENRPTTVRFRLQVDENSPIGDVPLTLQMTSGGIEIRKEFQLRVRSPEASLTIPMVSSNPSEMPPGAEADLFVVIENSAATAVRDITVRLDISDPNVPIAPLGGSTQKKVQLLRGGERQTVVFNLKSYADASSGIYKVPIELTFFDSLNNRFEQTDTIGIVVGAVPEVTAVFDSTTFTEGKSSGTVSVRIINRGFADVKFLTVSADNNDYYRIMNAPEQYVGNLDSDDFERVDFELISNSNVQGTFEFPITVTFRDTSNNMYTLNENIQVMVRAPDNGGPSWMIWLLIIALIVGGIVWWRRRSRS